MHRLLTRIIEGSAGETELSCLESLCDMVGTTSLCGLGQNAPNPTTSTLRYFREEYVSRLRNGSREQRLGLPVVAPVPGPGSGAGRNPSGGPDTAAAEAIARQPNHGQPGKEDRRNERHDADD
jgi:bidirectional [NiFe] hydrogenase diaphorase subunit